MGLGYFWPQTCGRALQFNYLRRHFDSDLGHSHLPSLASAGLRQTKQTIDSTANRSPLTPQASTGCLTLHCERVGHKS